MSEIDLGPSLLRRVRDLEAENKRLREAAGFLVAECDAVGSPSVGTLERLREAIDAACEGERE